MEKNAMSMREELSRIPTYSEELGLDLTTPGDRFKWFLASILFAKPISAEVAKRTYHRFVREGLVTPESIMEAGWERLVEVLDSGGYARYDFSTATELLGIMEELTESYGDLESLHAQASGTGDLERRLSAFKGIGKVGINIFLRELRGIWEKASPDPSKMAVEVAQRIGLEDVEAYESALVRIHIEHCKRKRCEECPVRDHCRDEN